MSKLFKVAQVSELSAGACKVVDAEGQSIALFNVDGTFSARAETLPATPVTDFLQRLGSG